MNWRILDVRNIYLWKKCKQYEIFLYNINYIQENHQTKKNTTMRPRNVHPYALHNEVNESSRKYFIFVVLLFNKRGVPLIAYRVYICQWLRERSTYAPTSWVEDKIIIRKHLVSRERGDVLKYCHLIWNVLRHFGVNCLSRSDM